MAYFTKQNLNFVKEQYSFANILNEQTSLQKKAARGEKFDVFISHSSIDKEYVQGLYYLLSYQLHLNVYVDWLVDPQLNRDNITVATAQLIKKRIFQSEILLYAVSSNAILSSWTKWEIGLFDGFKGKVCILPIKNTEEEKFKGNEFLMLYPKEKYYFQLDKMLIEDDKNIYKFANSPKEFKEWINE